MADWAARFFEFVQGADFYRELHREAVALLPEGQGRNWFDIGSGPGLVARLAAARGYAATGFDLDAAMVRRAARQGGARFERAGLDELVLRGQRADVVSAASLLSLLPDPKQALAALLGLVAPGGTLLVVETSEAMARGEPRVTVGGRRAGVLRLWARVRRGRAALRLPSLLPPGVSAEHHDLLGGWVDAWVVRPGSAG